MSFLTSFFSKLGQALRWWVVVVPWEQAVRVRMGNRMTILGPGVHVRVPWVDRIYRQSIRRRFSACPAQTLTTADGRAVTVAGALAYSITNIGLLYNTLHDAEDTIEIESQSLVAKFVRVHTLFECTPSAIEEAVTEGLNLERYGLGDVEFSITDYVAVKTYRLIGGEPRSYKSGASLSTTNEERSPYY